MTPVYQKSNDRCIEACLCSMLEISYLSDYAHLDYNNYLYLNYNSLLIWVNINDASSLKDYPTHMIQIYETADGDNHAVVGYADHIVFDPWPKGLKKLELCKIRQAGFITRVIK